MEVRRWGQYRGNQVDGKELEPSIECPVRSNMAVFGSLPAYLVPVVDPQILPGTEQPTRQHPFATWAATTPLYHERDPRLPANLVS
jgi:hypothetical protein